MIRTSESDVRSQAIERARRIADTWNFALHFEHQESDVRAAIERAICDAVFQERVRTENALAALPGQVAASIRRATGKE